MSPVHSHDYIQSYEAGIEALKAQPLDRDLQHKVVLALARAGALDFAMSEYNRFGLAAVQDHEDIMALNGRLSKDLSLRASGAKALQYARDAAEKYEQAFQSTLGHYSGINSATMAFMAGLPSERVSIRVEAIEALLPISPDVTPTDHYFIEATRAECFLLKGELSKAAEALQAAINYDPLNYTAHASTLKQFMMISAKQGESLEWLSDFKPPRPLHYAGHIRLNLNRSEQDAFRNSISDALQHEDVGFGFGALAAGADILFAEALLEQGAELHVVLPCAKDVFLQKSVVPFGEDWPERFEACWASAASIRILAEASTWPNEDLNRLSGLSAMGHTLLQGRTLSVAPLQMLVLNETATPSYTAIHAQDWAETGHPQFRLTDGTYCALNLDAFTIDNNIHCALKQSSQAGLAIYENITSALEAARDIWSKQEGDKIALHLEIDGENTESILDDILAGGAPQSHLASEAFASVLAVKGGDKFKITYAGHVKIDRSSPIRCYTIQPTSGSTYTLF